MASLPTRCPSCDEPMETGRIFASGSYLDWIPSGATINPFPLRREHLALGRWKPIRLTAARCRSCGLAVLRTP